MALDSPPRPRHTFATWVIEQDARELGVQYLLYSMTICCSAERPNRRPALALC